MRNRRLPRLILDCDGMLSNYVAGVIETIFELTGKRFRPEDVKAWNVCRELGLSDAETHDVHTHIAMTPGWAGHLPVCAGAREGVAMLVEIAEVYVATSPYPASPTWMWDRECWLRDRFGLPRSRILPINDKHLIAGDFFADDLADNVDAWANEHTYGIGVHWLTLHNQNERCRSRVFRVSRFDELCQIVKTHHRQASLRI